MRFGEKDISEFWKPISFPFFIMIAYSIVGAVLSFINFQAYIGIFGGMTGFFVFILLSLFLGWTCQADNGFSNGNSARAGALFGIYIGIASGIIGVVVIFFNPHIIDYSIQQAMAQGATAAQTDMIETFAKIGSFFAIIINSVLFGLLGALFAFLASLISKKISKNDDTPKKIKSKNIEKKLKSNKK